MGLSIGYMTIKAEPDRENRNVRRLKELKLFEYSVVTFPMNTEAALTGVKSYNNLELQVWLKEHLKQLKQQGLCNADILEALDERAAGGNDPELIQSLSNLISSIKKAS